MKKLAILVGLACGIMFFVGATESDDSHPRVGDIYRVEKNTYVPIFSSPETEFEYESSSYGSGCYDLETVLLPEFYVQIKKIFNNGVLEIVGTTNNSYLVHGYVHPKFVGESMAICGTKDFSSLRAKVTIPTVKSIMGDLKEISSKNGRYCQGGNAPVEIKLNDLYKFHQRSGSIGKEKKYICQGFDSSGLVHYLSNGYLPHDTATFLKFVSKLYQVSTERPLSRRMTKEIVSNLKDTDLVFFCLKDRNRKDSRGHVIMAYRFGFIESKGLNFGIVITPPHEAEARFTQMYEKAKSLGADLYVVRWHPELLEASNE
ncbi:MAG: hypothetical protein LBB18_01665 [Puniceicoccales bacterium]|jgi:hypothetical protein|nr:hypothetical protein [Puniceicoccales bacterium]